MRVPVPEYDLKVQRSAVAQLLMDIGAIEPQIVAESVRSPCPPTNAVADNESFLIHKLGNTHQDPPLEVIFSSGEGLGGSYAIIKRPGHRERVKGSVERLWVYIPTTYMVAKLDWAGWNATLRFMKLRWKPGVRWKQAVSELKVLCRELSNMEVGTC